MKSINLLALLASLFIFSCEGPPGYDGLDGRDGLDGIDGVNGEESFVFEYEFSFTAPEYGVLLNLPDDFTMLDSDVLQVYLLWEIKDDIEIWRPLSQTLYLDAGILHYNYDFTKFDTNIFLDGNINLDGLGAAYTDNWIARVVVVPGQFLGGRTHLDLSDYDQLKKHFDLSPSKLAKPGYSKRPE